MQETDGCRHMDGAEVTFVVQANLHGELGGEPPDQSRAKIYNYELRLRAVCKACRAPMRFAGPTRDRAFAQIFPGEELKGGNLFRIVPFISEDGFEICAPMGPADMLANYDYDDGRAWIFPPDRRKQ
jgi:hypothetical protein